MRWMFGNDPSLERLDLSGFKVDKVEDMEHMFGSDHNLIEIKFSSLFKTSKVTNMKNMFYGCSSLTSLDVSSFDTTSVTTMSGMFSYCSSLTELDLSSFNTKNVTDMGASFNNILATEASNYAHGMFQFSKKLKKIIFGDNFVTNKVTNMSGMFFGCYDLEELDLNGFDTSNVTNMDLMFDNMTSIETLNLCSFDISKVTTMKRMFGTTTKLNSIYVGPKWQISDNTNTEWMFNYSKSSDVITGQC